VSDPVKVPEDLQDRVKTIKGLLQLGVYATERLSSLETEMNYIERIAALTEQSENRHQRALSLARKIDALTEQVRELDEAWRTHVGNGTDKLTPQGLVSMIEDFQEEVRSLKEQVRTLSQPMTEEEFNKHHPNSVGVREVGFTRYQFNEIVTARSAAPGKEREDGK
jgi:polyhydroxyalkanoate synthesis regulator phasin